MIVESARMSSLSEADRNLRQLKVIDLAKRLGVRGYSNWDRVFSATERELGVFNGIGRSTLEKLEEFKRGMAEKAKISTGISEHAVKSTVHNKSKSSRYRLYSIDDTPISFPSAFNNENIIFLLQGDRRAMPIGLAAEQGDKTMDDVRSDIQFLNDHFDLGLEFKQVQEQGINYCSVNVPQKTKIVKW